MKVLFSLKNAENGYYATYEEKMDGENCAFVFVGPFNTEKEARLSGEDYENFYNVTQK